jgi:trimeric autotransporter adhesin
VNSVAVGPAATASASNAVALGANSVADRANTVSVGSSTAQRQIENLAAGTANTDAVNVSQLKGVTAALGGGAAINADGSVKAPVYNVYGNTYTNVGDALSNISNATSGVSDTLKYVKFGATSADVAQASAIDSLAIGGAAFATGQGALAIGTAARATYSNSVAIGYGSFATAANTFAVGGSAASQMRRIVNVADGVNDNDAATVGQVNSDIRTAINNLNLSSTHSQSTLLTSAVRSSSLLGATSSLTPDQLIVAGPTDKGNSIEATGTDAIAIGLATAADANNAVAVGGNARVASEAAVGIGQNVQAYGTNAVAMGSNAGATGNNAIVIGNNAAGATANDALAIGNSAQAAAQGAVAIGKNVMSSGTNSVALGYASDDGGLTNVVSVGSSKLQRRIINVAAGLQPTDAVNVSQLTGVTAALGGGATLNADGSIKKPTYTVQGTTATDVGTLEARWCGVERQQQRHESHAELQQHHERRWDQVLPREFDEGGFRCQRPGQHGDGSCSGGERAKRGGAGCEFDGVQRSGDCDRRIGDRRRYRFAGAGSGEQDPC